MSGAGQVVPRLCTPRRPFSHPEVMQMWEDRVLRSAGLSQADVVAPASDEEQADANATAEVKPAPAAKKSAARKRSSK